MSQVLIAQAQSLLQNQKWPMDQGWTQEQVENHLQNFPFLLHHQQEQATSLILYKKLPDLIEIDYLMTFPNFRKRGLMGALLTHLIGLHPRSRIWLEVHAENWVARRLYKKFGFENKGLRPKYYRDGGDGLLLERPAKV